MKKEMIKQLYNTFEQFALEVNGIECWSARELQELLGYKKWENFSKVIDKAKEACINVGNNVSDHFPDVRKMVGIGSGAERDIDDILLTRYACYLVAQNGDSRKEQIAFAQTYFAVQTRKAELIEQRLQEVERVKARAKLQETEKKLSGILYERGINEPDIKTIRILADYFGVTIDELVGHDIHTDQRQIPDIDMRIALSNGDEPITPAQYAEVIHCVTMALQLVAQDEEHLVVEVLIFVLDPLLYDTTCDFLIIVVEGQHLTAVLRHPDVDVGEQQGFVAVHGEFLSNLVDEALNLLLCLFVCFHILVSILVQR